ncbi:MAG: vitamin K epoxide reductase family protein [Actinobacteria bacterium]|nr:vitamin K epoxide reductase family protein [Actinomycetota bacterium]
MSSKSRSASKAPPKRTTKPSPGQPSPSRGGPTPPLSRVAPWQVWSSLVLSAGGLAVSIYLTLVHYTSAVPLACSDRGIVNCAKVTSSPESVIFGIPVAVFGLVFFAAMITLNLPSSWRNPSKRVAILRMGLAICGIGFVLYLVSVELLVVDAICLWCTSVHVITFLLLIVVGTATPALLEQGGEQGTTEK